MKNKFGWFLTTLAIMTFTFGQGSAAAVQIATAQAAAVPAAAVPAAVVSNAPVSPTDLTKVPHYFGPYSNWTNSPQVLSDAVVSMSPPVPTVAPVSVGNALIARAYATDTAPNVFVVLPNAKLPAGTLQNFKYWNQGAGGMVFHAYLLRPTGVANGYTVVYDSGAQTSPVPATPAGEVATVVVPSSVSVAAGDVIGFYGQGVAFDIGTASDTVVYPTPVAPALNTTMTLGVDAAFPIYPQARTYSFAVTVTLAG